MAFKEVEIIRATPWKPVQAGEAIEGKYMGSQELSGETGPFTSHRITTAEGILYGLTGKLLDDSFARIPHGAPVRVEYLGMVKLKNGRSAKNFRVMADDSVSLIDPAATAAEADELPFS